MYLGPCRTHTAATHTRTVINLMEPVRDKAHTTPSLPCVTCLPLSRLREPIHSQQQQHTQRRRKQHGPSAVEPNCAGSYRGATGVGEGVADSEMEAEGLAEDVSLAVLVSLGEVVAPDGCKAYSKSRPRVKGAYMHHGAQGYTGGGIVETLSPVCARQASATPCTAQRRT